LPLYYGEAIYGVDTYSSDNYQITGLTTFYLGSEIADGYETDAIFDELQIFSDDLTDTEIEDIFNTTIASTWTVDHMFLANFNNSINGGNLDAGVNIVSWNLYKKLSTELQYILLTNIDNDLANEYYDYSVANNIYYDYAIEGVGDDGSLTVKYVVSNNSVDFDGFWLIDDANVIAFQFLYNIPSVSINIDQDRTEYKTFSKYPIVKRGVYKIHKGQLSTTIDEDDDIYEQIGILEDMEGEQLILKFYTGQMYLVDIYNINHTTIDDDGYIKCEIKVDWVEVGEVA
jgi:hypothetical protein